MEGIGSGNQRSGADYANAALGITSLVKGLTNKKPKPLVAALYNANIRPAQGNEEALARTKNEIASSVSSASYDVTRMAGSDVNAGINGRIKIQKNAAKAISDAEFDNSQLLREDQNRVSQELSRQDLINNQLKNKANEINFEVDQNNYSATQTAASQGVQSAIQYEANRSADLRNKQVAEKQSNKFLDSMDEAHWYETFNKAIVSTGDKVKAKEIADEALKERSLSKYKTNFYTGRKGFFGVRRSQ